MVTDIMAARAVVLLERSQFRTIITAIKDPRPGLNRSPAATTFTVTIMERICTVALELMHSRTPLARTITDSMERSVVRLDRNHSRLPWIRDIMVS